MSTSELGQRPTEERFYAFVDCYNTETNCGTVGLTETEYGRQMDRPDAKWRCPKCGGHAEYNDTLSELVFH